MPAAHGGKRSPRVRANPQPDKKRQFRDVACELFAQFGYSSVGLDQIAERAGVSRAVLARSYRTKARLLRGIGDDWLASLFPDEVAAEELPIVVVNRLQAFSERTLASLRRDCPTARIILTGLAEPADEEESAIVHAMLGVAAERLTPIIHEGQQAGVIRRSLDSRQTAEDWLRFLLGAALMPLAEAAEGALPTRLIDTILHGVLKTDV